MPVRRSIITLAGMAAIAGVAAPMLWLAFVNYGYERQFPITADGPPPSPRFVDHAVEYTPYALWPTAVLFVPPTLPPHPPTKAEFYRQMAGLIAANAVIYAAAACAVSLLWRHARSHP